MIGGKMLYVCWLDGGEGTYYVIREDGEGGWFPVTMFLDQPGI